MTVDAIVLWVAVGATVLLLLFLGGFWFGTRPSIWERPAGRGAAGPGVPGDKA